jgi:hypothetical protein
MDFLRGFDMGSYPNRTLCEVLEEMRMCHKTRNYSYLMGLIEEVQSLGNRMESSLGDKGDCERWREDRTRLRKELKVLQDKVTKEGGA